MSTLEPLKQTKTILLTTYKRDGTPIRTPVSIAFDGERAFFRSYDKAWKTKRLRNNPRVEVAPCSLRGKPTGELGSPLTASFTAGTICSPICTGANFALPESGAHAESPINGTIVRWHILDASGEAFKLRVLRPVGADKYMAVGTSSAEAPDSTGLQTFQTQLPIQTGDLIGIDNKSASDELGFAAVVGSEGGPFEPQLAEGESASPAIIAPSEAAFNAEVEPAPPVIPAPIPPPDTTPVTSVVNVPHCLVPNLKGKKLKGSKKTLQGADCKVGKVTKKKGAKAATGKVVGQSKKPGTVLPAGSVVKVTLGKG